MASLDGGWVVDLLPFSVPSPVPRELISTHTWNLGVKYWRGMFSSAGNGTAGVKRPRRTASSASLPSLGKNDGGSNHLPSAYGEEDENVQPFLDFSHLVLRKHHESKPLWVCPNLRIYLEAFSPLYKHAYDFLIAICEPVARPTYVHEYKLTSYSLYAAVAVNIHTEHILSTLARFSKNELPSEVVSFVRRSTETYGKAKLLLRDNEYFIEAESKEVARKLLRNEVIKSARVPLNSGGGVGGGGGGGGGDGDGDFLEGEAAREMSENVEFLLVGRDEEDGDDLGPEAIHGLAASKTAIFQIAKEKVRRVKEAALTMDPPYPLMEEYDFRKDAENKALPIMLKSATKVRTYQQKSLRMMFGNGRARSGIIVLPCGAGKTLTGVTAASTIQKGVIILCNTNVSAVQWKAQFRQFAAIEEKYLVKFTSREKTLLPPEEAVVLITTYSMLAYAGKRNEEVAMILNQIKGREWGLMILDEVHVAPASSFQRVLDVVSAHAKLGLTATLVREDNLIDSLNSMIGPKLYEANWMDLTEDGYLANVQCVEAWCPMTREFFEEYLSVPDKYEGRDQKKVREVLYLMNPNKIRVCEYLMRYHEERGDKIIVFSDSVYALSKYAQLFGRDAIYGGTKESDRERLLAAFRISSRVNTIFLSRVGDTSIDLPEANVIIQISSQFGSRRQEAQRLGRILRPKQTADEGFNAFFYTLVCTDTVEMRYSTKRQQYLVDQGYTYKVIPNLLDDAQKKCATDPKYLMSNLNAEQELRLLTQALMDANTYEEMEAAEGRVLQRAIQEGEEEDGGSDRGMVYGGAGVAAAGVRRTTGSMAALSGGQGMAYVESSTGGKKRR